MSNIKNSPEYNKGYYDGFKEGYSEALKQTMDEIVAARSLRPIQFVINEGMPADTLCLVGGPVTDNEGFHPERACIMKNFNPKTEGVKE